MRFAALPFKNMFRRPARSLFAVIGISLAVGSFIALSVVLGGIVDNWQSSLASRGVHALVLQDMQVDWLASSVPEEMEAEVSAYPGIRAADGELISFVTASDGTTLLASGWRRDTGLWETLNLVAGEIPRDDRALAGQPIAQAIGLGVGDVLILDDLEIEIAGIFQSDDVLMSGRVILPLDTLQNHMFRQGTVTVLHVIFEDPTDPNALADLSERINTGHPGLSVRASNRLAEDNRVINLLDVLRNVVVSIIAVAGVAGTANIMLMAANERRAEIGLLLAIGWSPARVVSLFLMEAVFLAAVSGVIGIGLGALIIEIVRSSATLAAFLSDAISLPVILEGLALAIGIGTIGGVAPALSVIRVPADEALRSI